MTHERTCKDSQQKQSSVVCYSEAITGKDSQQKQQGFTANSIVICSSGDHRKSLMKKPQGFVANAIVSYLLQWGNHHRCILVSDQAHFDQVSAILDSNWEEACTEMKRCPREWLLGWKRSNGGGGGEEKIRLAQVTVKEMLFVHEWSLWLVQCGALRLMPANKQ